MLDLIGTIDQHDGGHRLFHAGRAADGGWSPFTALPFVTTHADSVVLEAWDTTRLDVAWRGACQMSDVVCQAFWIGSAAAPFSGAFSTPFNLGRPAGPSWSGPLALVSTRPNHLTVLATTSQSLHASTWSGSSWSNWTSAPLEPNGSSIVDNARFDALGLATISLPPSPSLTVDTITIVAKRDSNRFRFELVDRTTAFQFVRSWSMPSAIDTITNASTSRPAVTFARPGGPSVFAMYDLSATPALWRRELPAGSPERVVGTQPRLAPVAPACASTNQSEVCVVLEAETLRVWQVERQGGRFSWSEVAPGAPLLQPVTTPGRPIAHVALALDGPRLQAFLSEPPTADGGVRLTQVSVQPDGGVTSATLAFTARETFIDATETGTGYDLLWVGCSATQMCVTSWAPAAPTVWPLQAATPLAIASTGREQGVFSRRNLVDVEWQFTNGTMWGTPSPLPSGPVVIDVVARADSTLGLFRTWDVLGKQVSLLSPDGALVASTRTDPDPGGVGWQSFSSIAPLPRGSRVSVAPAVVPHGPPLPRLTAYDLSDDGLLYRCEGNTTGCSRWRTSLARTNRTWTQDIAPACVARGVPEACVVVEAGTNAVFLVETVDGLRFTEREIARLR